MTADIITGPWKKIDQTEKELEKAQLLADCDQISSDCMVSVLHTLAECGMAPEDPDDEHIEYVVFLSELIKSIVYTNVKLEHPFQDMVEAIVIKSMNINNERTFSIDYQLLNQMLESVKNVEDEKDPA
tara:strand:+ start:133 stop:516 length:384 start_codon:yes stop_codon:yes gene_type:complete